MKERQRGSIITMSSAAGRRPHARSPIPYSVAKAGIELSSQEVAVEAGRYGIRANCIAPETILTERNLERIGNPTQSGACHSRNSNGTLSCAVYGEM
jgi:3-oxoacyl-[acyl-carrier protein] reductase